MTRTRYGACPLCVRFRACPLSVRCGACPVCVRCGVCPVCGLSGLSPVCMSQPSCWSFFSCFGPTGCPAGSIGVCWHWAPSSRLCPHSRRRGVRFPRPSSGPALARCGAVAVVAFGGLDRHYAAVLFLGCIRREGVGPRHAGIGHRDARRMRRLPAALAAFARRG